MIYFTLGFFIGLIYVLGAVLFFSGQLTSKPSFKLFLKTFFSFLFWPVFLLINKVYETMVKE
jgi:hypothetical protein